MEKFSLQFISVVFLSPDLLGDGIIGILCLLENFVSRPLLIPYLSRASLEFLHH